MKTTLTIAGSDSSGGAGVQADLKTMIMTGVYGMSAITALTAQNTQGVRDIMEASPEFLGEQLDAVFTDIYPDAVKIGMVASSDLIRTIAEKLSFYQAKKIVLDPVMVATSGARLIEEDAIESLKQYLFPLALLVTPNLPEAKVLSGLDIQTEKDMEEAAKKIGETYQCNVLVKGGHRLNDANDVLYLKENKSLRWFYGEHIDNNNTHGTGDTLSSAIASYLAQGDDLEEAVKKAKAYLSNTLKAMLDLGKGSGPLDHAFILRENTKA